MAKQKGARPSEKPSSLFIFGEDHFIRRYARSVIEWKWFEYAVLLAIVANCVVLALEEHLPDRDRTPLSLMLEVSEPYFVGIFCVEATLKIVALGFLLYKNSYLRNVWNILDFIVVLTGIANYVIESSGYQNDGFRMLRSFRVLRPLKLMSKTPSLQTVLQVILKAMVPLSQIGLLVMFTILIFAIIGLHFYEEALHTTCYRLPDKLEIELEGDVNETPCTMMEPSMALRGAYICPNTSGCRSGWAGPNYGITSFDNIYLAMLTVFQCIARSFRGSITVEGWTSILYWTNDALGSAYNWIYFVPLIIIGSFIMLNLALVVFAYEFSKQRDISIRRHFSLLLRERHQIQWDLRGYFEWIRKGEEVVLADEETPEEVKIRITEAGQEAEVRQRRHCFPLVTNFLKVVRRHVFWRHVRRFRRAVHRGVKSQAYHWFMILVVFLNTVCFAVEHNGQPPFLTDFLYKAEFVFLGLFVSEMLIKIFALGMKGYYASLFNRFDCIVIIASIFELIWFELKGESIDFSAFRSVRLFRIFKFTKYWSSLRNLILSLINSLRSIMSLLFLLFLFIFLFALLGMQLFGGSFNFDNGTPTGNFDTFSIALLTVFQILTGEDWNKVMYNAIESQGGVHHGGLIYSIYFIVLIIFGRYILLNVFLAIAVDYIAFDQDNSIDEDDFVIRKDEEEEDEEDEEDEKDEEEEENEKDEEDKEDEEDEEEEVRKWEEEEEDEEKEEEGDRKWRPWDEEAEDGQGNKRARRKRTSLKEDRKRKTDHSSMFIFSSANPIRRGAHYITSMRYFDAFIITIISASTVALALEDPVEEKAHINSILFYFDYAFAAVFTVEMLLKLVDLGVCFHPGSYFRDLWNILDYIVVICTLSTIAARCPVVQLYVSKGVVAYILTVIASLRIIRVLLLLKIIKRVPKLNAVFDCVVTSIKNVFVILIIYLLFFFIFAVIAVRLFNGRFHYCNDESRLFEEDCKGRFFVFTSQNDPPFVRHRIWERRQFHFDNVVSAMLTLFTVQTGEGWPTILQHSMDSVYKGHGPLPHFRIEVSIFYVVFFIVFPFFFVNIFIASVINTFQYKREMEFKYSELNRNSRDCIEFCIHAKPRQLYMPKNKPSLKYAVWRMVVSTAFEYATMALIVFNTILLMMKSNQQSNEHKYILYYTNHIFTALFAIECLLKVIAFGLRNFFKDPWNTFDFITVCGTVIDALVIERRLLALKNFDFSFFRLFRLVRLFKLLQKSYNIRMMLRTFLRSFKELPYVCLLIAMLFSVYAIVGMQAFGNIDLNANSAINRHNNFQTFIQALLLLFRCATGENWQMIMMSCRSGRPCDPKTRSNDDSAPSCGSDIAYVYFVTFIFFCTFLMLNLFIAVIMDNFDYLTRDWSILGAHHLEDYIRVWSDYDPDGTGYLHHTKLYDLLINIDPPLGFGKLCPRRIAYKCFFYMNMPLTADGKVNFTTTLFALIRGRLKIKMRGNIEEADDELCDILKKLWPLLSKEMLDKLVPPIMELEDRSLTVGEHYAGLYILEILRYLKAKAGQGANQHLHRTTGNDPAELESPPPADQTDPTDPTDQTIPTPPTIVLHPAVSSPISSPIHTSSFFNRVPPPNNLYELVETIKSKSNEAVNYKRKDHLTRPPACLFCLSPDHYALHCDAHISDENKLEAIFDANQLCWRCLMPDHHTRECYTKAMCSICQRSHNTIVHSVVNLSTIGLSDAQLQIIQDAQQVLPPTGKDPVVLFQPNRKRNSGVSVPANRKTPKNSSKSP